jgi:hypothetical protein
MVATKYFHRPIFIILLLFFLSNQGKASTTVWDVTLGDDGHTHYIHNPLDAMSDLTDLLTEAKTWLLSHSSTDTLILFFPYQTYIFNQYSVQGLWINGFTKGNLVLRGEQIENQYTRLQFQVFDKDCIRIQSSHHVTIEKFWLTRGGCGDAVNGLYTTQGIFTGVGNDGKNYITFEVEEGFPDPVWLASRPKAKDYERTFLAFSGTDMEPEVAYIGKKVRLDTSMDAPIVSISNNTYKAYLADNQPFPTFWTAGVTKIALKTKCGNHTIRIHNACNDLILRDLKITNFAGNPIRFLGGGNRLIVQRVVVDRPEAINGKMSCFSGPAGGIQVYCGSEGAIIEDCKVIATADDGIGYFSNDPNLLAQNGKIINNYISDTQARGILITQSENGICCNNTIVRGESHSILLKNESGGEGTNAAVCNWHITNNTFIQPWVYPVIAFESECKVSGLHNNNYIEDNIFYEAPTNNVIVYIDDSDTTYINNNQIVSFMTGEDYHDSSRWGSSTALVYVYNGHYTSGNGNIFQQPLIPPTRKISEKRLTGDELNVSWEFSDISTNHLSHEDGWEAFPNPFTNEIWIKSTTGEEKYQLMDALGRTIYQGSNISDQNFTSCAGGCYFLKILNDKGSYKTIKLIKNNVNSSN